jgi:hypothetical protein
MITRERVYTIFFVIKAIRVTSAILSITQENSCKPARHRQLATDMEQET